MSGSEHDGQATLRIGGTASVLSGLPCEAGPLSRFIKRGAIKPLA